MRMRMQASCQMSLLQLHRPGDCLTTGTTEIAGLIEQHQLIAVHAIMTWIIIPGSFVRLKMMHWNGEGPGIFTSAPLCHLVL